MMRRRKRHFFVALAFCVAGHCVDGRSALGTWSIIIVDTESREIAIGSATCVPGIDLEAAIAVVLVDRGAAAAQSAVDFGAINRIVIRQQMLAGTLPQQIISILATQDAGHQSRQYGIANVGTKVATFTGSSTSAYAGGVTGQADALVYAIQGNILTGAGVVEMAEQAVLNTNGGLVEKLMAAMEAAQTLGGDGRCSCTREQPIFDPDCGSPPLLSFDKSADVGFMIVTRTGDTDGVCDAINGCANGDYFMNLNVAFQTEGDADPVFQLREAFDLWRSGLVGRTDAVRSVAVVEPPAFLADGTGTAVMTITLRDWQGTLVPDDSLLVTVEHADDSDRTTGIGAVISEGSGVVHVELTGSDTVGRDLFLVTVHDPLRPVVLIPRPTLLSLARSDVDADGDVDLDDASAVIACLDGPGVTVPTECAEVDFNADGFVDLSDVRMFQRDYSGATCVELAISEQPQSPSVSCGLPFTLQVAVEASPPPSFQWFLDDAPIEGADEPQYAVAIATSSDLGLYRVEITNTCGTVVSDEVLIDPARPCP